MEAAAAATAAAAAHTHAGRSPTPAATLPNSPQQQQQQQQVSPQWAGVNNTVSPGHSPYGSSVGKAALAAAMTAAVAAAGSSGSGGGASSATGLEGMCGDKGGDEATGGKGTAASRWVGARVVCATLSCWDNYEWGTGSRKV
jgi:hypothetical protein